MLEFALHNEVKRTIKSYFGTKKVIYDTQTFYVDSPNYIQRLDNGIYFLINDTIDVPTTAKVIIQAQSNILTTTKDSYKNLNLKPFRGYLKVKTLNYGTEFVPYSLTFLKITPYE